MSLEEVVEVFYLPWDALEGRVHAYRKMECEMVCNGYKSSLPGMANFMQGYGSFQRPNTRRFTFDVIKSVLRKPWMVTGDAVSAVRGFLGQALQSLPESPEIIQAAAGATAALCALSPSQLEHCFPMLKAGNDAFNVFAHEQFFKLLVSPTPDLLQETKQARARMDQAGVIGEIVNLFVEGSQQEMPALQNAAICGLGYLGLFMGPGFMQDEQFQGMLGQWAANPAVAEGVVRIIDALVCGGDLESYGRYGPVARYLEIPSAGVWDAVAQLLIDAEALAYCQNDGMIQDIVQLALQMFGQCSSLKVVKKLRTVLSMGMKHLMDSKPDIVEYVCAGCVEKISALFTSQNAVFGNENAVRIAREAARVVESVFIVDRNAGLDLLVKLCLEGRDLSRDKGHLMSLLVLTDELLHDNRKDCLVDPRLLAQSLIATIWPCIRDILSLVTNPMPSEADKNLTWPPIRELLDPARNPVKPDTYYQNYFLLRVACRILYYLWAPERSDEFKPCLWSCYTSLVVLSEPVDEGRYTPMAQEFLEILKNLSEWLPYFEIFGNTADSNMQALCNNMICAGESKRDDVYFVVGILADDESVNQIFELLRGKLNQIISPENQVVVARHILSFLAPVVKFRPAWSVRAWEFVQAIGGLLGRDKQLMALAANMLSPGAIGQQIQYFWEEQDPAILCALFKVMSSERILGSTQRSLMLDFLRRMIPKLKQSVAYMASVPLESREFKLVVVPLMENLVLFLATLTRDEISQLPTNVLLDLVSHMLRLMYRRPELSANMLGIVSHADPGLIGSVDIWGPAFSVLLKRSFDPLSYGTRCVLLNIREITSQLQMHNSHSLPDVYGRSLGLYGGQMAVEFLSQIDFARLFVDESLQANDFAVLYFNIIRVIAAKNQCLFR